MHDDDDDLDLIIKGPKPIPRTALEYLQSIYRDPMRSDSERMRAAKEALPYESPKLSAVAMAQLINDHFAGKLDRAIERSNVIPLAPVAPSSPNSGEQVERQVGTSASAPAQQVADPNSAPHSATSGFAKSNERRRLSSR